MTITVAGAMALQYLPHLMICPSFAAVAIPTTFAEAPMGVALPPISVPMANAQERTVISIPGVVAARLVITGIIVAANGMLSMKALATAETMTIIAIIRAIFPPLTFSMIPARIFRTPVCSRPPTTTKRPIKKRSV